MLQVNDQKVVTASFQIPARLNPAGITNGANYVAGAVVPGELINLFGLGFSPGALTHYEVSGGVVTGVLDQTRVLFDGAPAPLIYVSGDLIGAVVPYAVAGKTRTVVQVEYQGRAGNPVTVPVVAAAPALIAAD